LPLRFLVFCLLILAAGPAVAEESAALAALRGGGTVALLRHALAPGTGDPSGFRIDDCATQRNLDPAGRQQAEDIGRLLRDSGVDVSVVRTSRWCRARDTARLLDVGPVEEAAYLDSFFSDRSTASAQTEDLRRSVVEWTGPGVLILVTHQVNITALTGIVPRSGEMVVLRPRPFSDTGFLLVGRL